MVGGGGGGGVGEDRVGGVRVDVNEELKFLGKFKKKKLGGGSGVWLGGGGRVGGVRVDVNEELKFLEKFKKKLELMFMKHYAPNRCLYIKVAKLRTGVGSAEMSHLQNRCLKIVRVDVNREVKFL